MQHHLTCTHGGGYKCARATADFDAEALSAYARKHGMNIASCMVPCDWLSLAMLVIMAQVCNYG